MANFMGPMAPPQAAPQTPPQLDIRTNPGQRAQFKTFMQGMSRPAAPPTTAPIAPMLPAPTPAEQIDIFAPVPMANGGLADPFDRPSPKMVGGTTNVIDASGGNTGGGSSDLLDGTGFTQDDIDRFGRAIDLGADLYDVNQSYNDPSRPLFGASRLFAPGEAFGGMLPSAPSVPNMMQNAMQGILGATQMDGPMGGTFGISPVTRDGNLGIMANFTVPFEDGGPVRMRRGGVTFKSGRTYETGRGIGEQNREMDALERGVPSGVSGDDPYDEFSGGGGYPADGSAFTFDSPSGVDDDGSRSGVNRDNTEPVADALATIAAMDAAQESYVPGQVTTRERPLSEVSGMDSLIARNQQTTQGFRDLLSSMDDIDGSAGDFATVSPVAAAFTPFVDPQTDLLFGEPTASLQQDALSAVEALIGSQPQPRDDARPDMVMRQNPVSFDPMTAPYMGMGADDFDFGPALPRDADIINNLLNRRVNYTTRSGNVIDRTVQDDLIERGKPSGLPGFIGKGLDILGANKAGKYLDQIAGGAPGVIDASTGQLVGYVGEGFIKGSQVFSGRPGYNPFTGDGQNVKFDPSTNSYIVTPGQPNQGEDDQQRNRASSLPVGPFTDTTDTTPPPVTPPVVTPPAMPDPMDVVVPSTRVADPLGLTPPAFAPVQSVGLPQSFLDLLASFNRPAPVAMQDGGAVLDRAADNFLEALKVA